MTRLCARSCSGVREASEEGFVVVCFVDGERQSAVSLNSGIGVRLPIDYFRRRYMLACSNTTSIVKLIHQAPRNGKHRATKAPARICCLNDFRPVPTPGRVDRFV